MASLSAVADSGSAAPTGSNIVILKVGTSSLVDPATHAVQVSSIARIAEAASALAARGFRPIVVSSGAVGLGCARLGLRARPTSIAGKQAAAAVGQGRLMSLYDGMFGALGACVAQVLLTYDNFGDRAQHANARCALLELLRLGVIPIVNENDTVAVQELRVGDNDTLSALVAAMVGARYLLLLTDVEGLYEADPRSLPGARLIGAVQARDIYGLRRQMASGCARLVPGEAAAAPAVAAAAAASPRPKSGGSGSSASSSSGGGGGSSSSALPSPAEGSAAPSAAAAAPASSPSSSSTGGAGSAFGTGGMATKLKAAQLATAAGTTTVILSTARVERIVEVLCGSGSGSASANSEGTTTTSTSTSSSSGADSSAGEHFSRVGLGTTFFAVPAPVTVGRKRWVLSMAPSGTLLVDDGAAAAVREHKSLFSAGLVGVEGVWDAQDAVALVSASDGKEFARALVNYSSGECSKLKGLHSGERGEALGYEGGAEAGADRGHIVVL
jgi:glutamate 5-kinase